MWGRVHTSSSTRINIFKDGKINKQHITSFLGATIVNKELVINVITNPGNPLTTILKTSNGLKFDENTLIFFKYKLLNKLGSPKYFNMGTGWVRPDYIGEEHICCAFNYPANKEFQFLFSNDNVGTYEIYISEIWLEKIGGN